MEVKPWIHPREIQDNDSLARIVREICANEPLLAARWGIEYGTDAAQQWIRFIDESVELPPQGWKLHISASIFSAEAMLHRILPVLLRETTGFKVAASLKKLLLLNRGEAGNSQIGKFITIYPKDDSEAVRLAVLLDEVTRGLSGPNVPSDRPLYPGSLVSYRYGGMGGQQYIQNALGMIEPALRKPDGKLIPDKRQTWYEPPSWVSDPFIAAGVATELPEPERFIAGRYLILANIAASVNHSIYLGVDMEGGRSCIIKGPGYAGRNSASDISWHKSMRHEADVLAQLAPDRRFPTLFDLVEEDGTLYLIMQDMEGKTLLSFMQHLSHQGQHLSQKQVLSWGQELADMLQTIHEKGMVYADLKSSNVIVGVDGSLHLIDFELSCPQGCDDEYFRGRGTRGYMSPQQLHSQLVTIQDDIYGLGALLYFMVTGLEPSLSFRKDADLLVRPVEWLRPDVDRTLKEIITRCVSKEREDRYCSMNEVKSALASLEHMVPIATMVRLCEPAQQDWSESRWHYRELAGRLLETLCTVAKQPANKRPGLVWESTHQMSRGSFSRDVNTGNGGTVLALAELVAEHPERYGHTTLADGALWLSTAPKIGQRTLPGLYVGEAGTGAALLRAGQVLHDQSLIEEAIQRGRNIASLPYASPDIFNGTAGRLRFHLFLWDETGDREHLDAALACGEHLLAAADMKDNREVCWTIPEGYGDMSGQTMLGYAHGAAGIADTLIDLFEATGDERFLPAIQGTGRWLQRQAVVALDDESGLCWPSTEGGRPTTAYWCHGATGIGRFFLHAATSGTVPDAMEIAHRAANTVAYGTRWAGPTQCHGLAGNIEFLLDMYQASSDSLYLEQAFALAKLLETFGVEQGGNFVFSGDTATTFSPDYMTGYAGVAVCLLRLSAPERLPHQLSRKGFRSGKTEDRKEPLAVNER